VRWQGGPTKKPSRTKPIERTDDDDDDDDANRRFASDGRTNEPAAIYTVATVSG